MTSSSQSKLQLALRTAGTIAAGVAGAIFFVWPLGTWAVVRNLDSPRYKVIKPLTKSKSWLHSGYVAEVRQYQPYIIASVDIEDKDMDTALSNGFRAIANFIFGNNTKDGAVEKVAMTAPVGLETTARSEKVAMTAPVGLETTARSEKVAMTAPVGAEMLQDGSQYRVWFMMPFKYTSIDQLPRPNNDRVTLRQVPAQTLAAITFCGPSPREDMVAAKRDALLALLKEAGVEAVPGVAPKLWQYHPPFAPPWQRRNEVLLDVQGVAVEAAST